MPNPQSVTKWLDEHQKAVDHLARLRAANVSWRQCHRALQKEHDYPFNTYTGLMCFWRDSKSKTVRRARASVPTFKRTAADLKKLAKGETFFFTSAVNNCHVDAKFADALEMWQGHTLGKVLVNPILYKNPTRRVDEQELDPDVWWDERLNDWMLQDELRIHPKLALMATKPQATSNNPVPPKLESLTKDRSAVFGHPQISMRTVATPQDALPKILYSSGAITEKGYSDTPTGDLAEFHHSLGGVIAEVRGNRFHLREVSWDGEQFIDIDTSFDHEGVWHAPPSKALVMGDIHVGLHSDDVMEATFGSGGIVEVTSAEKLLLHDLPDFKSVNPHERSNRLTRAAMWTQGNTNLQRELRMVRAWLEEFPDSKELETYVVASNHDDFLRRWLESGERYVEPENLSLYHHLSAEMLDHHDARGEFPNPLEVGLARVGYLGAAKFLRLDESLRIEGVELGMHGHLGSNGSRGSAKGLSRIGTRSIIGHSHSPMIWQGVYQVGHSAVNRHGYNHGPSSWLTSHALVLANGRRQMLHLIDGHFRG